MKMMDIQDLHTQIGRSWKEEQKAPKKKQKKQTKTTKKNMHAKI